MVDGRCHRCGVLGAHALEADCIWSLSRRIDKLERDESNLAGGAADWLPPRPGVQRGAKPETPRPSLACDAERVELGGAPEPKRVESGSVQIGDDDFGVYIRGMDARAFAAHLRKTPRDQRSLRAQRLIDLLNTCRLDYRSPLPVRLQLAEPLTTNDNDGD